MFPDLRPDRRKGRFQTRHRIGGPSRMGPSIACVRRDMVGQNPPWLEPKDDTAGRPPLDSTAKDSPFPSSSGGQSEPFRRPRSNDAGNAHTGRRTMPGLWPLLQAIRLDSPATRSQRSVVSGYEHSTRRFMSFRHAAVSAHHSPGTPPEKNWPSYRFCISSGSQFMPFRQACRCESRPRPIRAQRRRSISL